MTATATTPNPEFNVLSAVAEEIYNALLVLLPPGSVAELRIPNTDKGTYAGYFDDVAVMASRAADWSGNAPAIYFTLNPVNPALLSRARNRLKLRPKETTTDKDVLSRRWFPLDIDPVRPAGISATDAEHAAALGKAQECKAWLTAQGWPLPLAGDSGNGANLLYRIDLPNDEPSKILVEHGLKALAQKFSDAQTEIDEKVGNAARIWKVYGTTACKGDAGAERPHRIAQLLEIPAEIGIVTREQLEAVAALASALAPKKTRPGVAFDVAGWLAQHGIAVDSLSSYEGGTKYILRECPLNSEHKKSAVVIQFPSGKISARCLHQSCAALDWNRLREMYEPAATWRSELLLSDSGAPRPLLSNACLMLRQSSEWRGVLTFNEFSLLIETEQPAPWPESSAGEVWTDDHDSRTACWLQQQGIAVNSKTAGEAAKVVAREHPYHPIKRYLASLDWDRKPRIDNWLRDYLGAEDTALNAVMGAKWLIRLPDNIS